MRTVNFSVPNIRPVRYRYRVNVALESIQSPYRSLKDFGTVGETKEKCGKGKTLIITDGIAAEGPIKDEFVDI